MLRRGFRVLVGGELAGPPDMTENDAWKLFLLRARTAPRIELQRNGHRLASIWNPIKEVN